MNALYVGSFIAAAVFSGLFTRLLVKFARQRQLFMPTPRERDIHINPVPRVGGIAIVAAFLLIVLAVSLAIPNAFSFSGQRIIGLDKNLVGLLLGVLLLTAVNIYDDYKSVPWQLRLLVQALAALCIFWFGIHIYWLTNPLGGSWVLGSLEWLFIVVWLVGLSNVVNWLDGVDGLAGGVSTIALAVLFFLSISPDVAQSPNALLSIIACGAVVGFLPMNLSPAKAFLGDTGSVFLGFLIGVIAIISGGKVATAFLVLAIPFLDALVVFVARVVNGRSPFLADKRHLHHRLLELGMKPWQIVLLFWGISLLFGLVALNTQSLGKLRATAAAAGLMAGFLGLYWLALRARRRRANQANDSAILQ